MNITSTYLFILNGANFKYFSLNPKFMKLIKNIIFNLKTDEQILLDLLTFIKNKKERRITVK